MNASTRRSAIAELRSNVGLCLLRFLAHYAALSGSTAISTTPAHRDAQGSPVGTRYLHEQAWTQLPLAVRPKKIDAATKQLVEDRTRLLLIDPLTCHFINGELHGTNAASACNWPATQRLFRETHATLTARLERSTLPARILPFDPAIVRAPPRVAPNQPPPLLNPEIVLPRRGRAAVPLVPPPAPPRP